MREATKTVMRCSVAGSHRAVRGTAAFAMLAAAACASFTTQQTGAMIGAATGAVAGGAIGKANGSTAKGAIIGAMVGGVAGGIIGRQMDKQAAEIAQKIPGATVERVGEGIQVTFESGLLYDFDSDRVRSEAGANLRNLAASLDQYPNTDLLIVGHTDSDGPGDYNDDLSSRRARAAADYLEARGVDRRRLRTSGRGEREPVASNDTETGREQNRRVEVAIFASESYRKSLTGR
jgi:outer membrane protein OmpA-like peptidoglycan-associated protein